MKEQADIEFQQVLEKIKSHFDFLFQRGYNITSALFTDEQNKHWNVILAGDNCIIKIHNRNRTLHLELCSVKLFNHTGLFDLHELVHLMNHKDDLPPRNVPSFDDTEQFTVAAQILEEHLDEILILFEKIHTGIAFSRAGELLNSPARLIPYRTMN